MSGCFLVSWAEANMFYNDDSFAKHLNISLLFVFDIQGNNSLSSYSKQEE